jgi:putative ABC transport system permease protein
MLVVQGALSVLLLVGAGLFVRSLIQAETADLGLDTDRLLVVDLVQGPAGMPDDLVDRLRAEVDRMPGVEETTRVNGTLPFVSSWAVRLAVDGLPERPRLDDGGPYIAAVEPGYFEATGTKLERGRVFTTEDRLGAPPVVIVNQVMARLYWPGEDPVGKCLRIGSDEPPCSRVVGVAADTRRQELVEGDSLLYYVPKDQATSGLREGGWLLIRTAESDASTLGRVAESVRRSALALDSGLRYVSARQLDDIISPQLRAWRLGAGLFSTFGALALVVATLGLYSVVAFDVEGRRREMGVRAALGADRASLVALVVREGLKASATGLLAGIVLAWLLAPVVSGLLYGVPPRDGRLFLLVTAVLVGAALLASAVPGLRAGRVDPSIALREE